MLHRSTTIYGDDAEVFSPERWSDGKARGWGYLPFNGGPRICIGRELYNLLCYRVVSRANGWRCR